MKPRDVRCLDQVGKHHIYCNVSWVLWDRDYEKEMYAQDVYWREFLRTAVRQWMPSGGQRRG